MPPVTRRDAEPGDPVDRPAALGTVEHPPCELPLEIGLHLQEFLPQHLCLHRERVRAVQSGGMCLTHDGVSLGRLLAHGAHRALEDLGLPLPHRILAIRSARAFAARSSWRWVIRATRSL